MGIYFISDPDGYWLEVIPKVKPKTLGAAALSAFFIPLNRIILFIFR